MQKNSGKCGENLTWRLENDTLVISGKGPMENFFEHVDSNHWTADHDEYDISPWLYWNEDVIIRKLVVEEGVTSIGENAFGNTDIVWRDYKGDFLHWSNQHMFLESVSLPESVTRIEAWAFLGCIALCNVELPSSLQTIGSGAFSGCEKLEYLEIPQSVREVAPSAFHDTPFERKLLSKTGLIMINNCTYRYSGNDEYVEIPDGTEVIRMRLFKDHKELTGVKIPYGVKKISEQAFRGCTGLKSITIPDSVEEIEALAFYGCENLSQINMNPDTITISENAFEKTAWWEQQMSQETIIFKDTLFKYNGNKERYTIPAGVKKIKSSAFDKSPLKELVITQSVQSMYLTGCANLESLYLPEGTRMRFQDMGISYCPSIKKIYYGDSKEYTVNGVVSSDCAGDNVIWIKQTDDTILFFGNGSVDIERLMYSIKEEYSDVGSYRIYRYKWDRGFRGKKWSGNIYVGRDVKLREPLPEVVPPYSNPFSSVDVESTSYNFQVYYKGDNGEFLPQREWETAKDTLFIVCPDE